LPTISAKLVGVGAVSQRLIPTGERSGLYDAQRGDGKRFVVRTDEKLTIFPGVNRRFATIVFDILSPRLSKSHSR